MGHSTMESWISRYRSEGGGGIGGEWEPVQAAVQRGCEAQGGGEYMSSQGSSMAIVEKYQLLSGKLVLDWVKVYHKRNFRQETGGSVMRKEHTEEGTVAGCHVLSGWRIAA